MDSPLADRGRSLPALSRAHTRRLRELYRSAGWPCLDAIEIDLLAAGLLERLRDDAGRETLRLTDAGIAVLAQSLQRNRAAMDAHEALVEVVATQLQRAGRVVFTGLSLRARVGDEAEDTARWVMAKPDVYSIRNTSKEGFLAPTVHEIKVRRADVLGELKRPDKRAAYLDMSSEAWFVLGRDAKGREIADASELPTEFGVLQLATSGTHLSLVRPAPKRGRSLSFGVWLALARAVPREASRQAQEPL